MARICSNCIFSDLFRVPTVSEKLSVLVSRPAEVILTLQIHTNFIVNIIFLYFVLLFCFTFSLIYIYIYIYNDIFLLYSIQDYLYSAFYDIIDAKQLYRKLRFYNRFIYYRNLIYLTNGKIWLILYILKNYVRFIFIYIYIFFFYYILKNYIYI